MIVCVCFEETVDSFIYMGNSIACAECIRMCTATREALEHDHERRRRRAASVRSIPLRHAYPHTGLRTGAHTREPAGAAPPAGQPKSDGDGDGDARGGTLAVDRASVL